MSEKPTIDFPINGVAPVAQDFTPLYKRAPKAAVAETTIEPSTEIQPEPTTVESESKQASETAPRKPSKPREPRKPLEAEELDFEIGDIKLIERHAISITCGDESCLRKITGTVADLRERIAEATHAERPWTFVAVKNRYAIFCPAHRAPKKAAPAKFKE